MKVFTSGLKPGHRLDYPAIVNDLVRRVPPEHLMGIAYVTVSGDRPLDDDEDVIGQYYERYERDPAVIVLYLESMKREAPALLRLFPITWKVLIAQTLFHEIGHHYQRFSHGIAKNHQEDHAESYGERYTRLAFPRAFAVIQWTRSLKRWWNRVMIGLLEIQAQLWPRAVTHYRLGRRYWDEEQWTRVVGHWERAVAMDPWFKPAREALPQARAISSRAARRASAAAAYRRPRSVRGRRRKRP